MHLAQGPSRLCLPERGCVATIGNFDGVHLGHRAVIERLAEVGRARQLPVCVVLFEPQPREYFEPDRAPPRLMRLREKLIRLSELPVDQVLLLRFQRRLANLSAEDFIDDLLIRRLRVQHLVIGDDFRFGQKRRGDFAMLRAFGQRAGFEVVDTASVVVDGERVSSTLIREALACTDLDRAARLLGRPYSVCGPIVHGDKRGRTLGFPTANVLMRRKNTPLQGVFAVTMTGIARKPVAGVANVGIRPTVDGRRVLLETHLLDFSAEIYGRKVEVIFHRKLRDETRFAGLAELRNQIETDVISAKRYFAELHPSA